ncbi:hypothetical protein [Sorangium sp. So ce1078]|uniref:hypothetical protein n=1 Tax=Sorangium sp. So ce1078 TaxID=3133329 RepID=UPI003F5E8859
MLSRSEGGDLAGQLVLSDGRAFPVRVQENGGRVTVEMTVGAGGRVVLIAAEGVAGSDERGARGVPPAAGR